MSKPRKRRCDAILGVVHVQCAVVRSVGVPPTTNSGATPFLASQHRRPRQGNPRRQECHRTCFGIAERPRRRTALGQDCPSHASQVRRLSWRRSTAVPAKETRDDRNVVAPVLASQSVPADEPRLDRIVQATGATPFLASQSVPADKARSTTNVQATWIVLLRDSATTGMSSHPFGRRKVSPPTTHPPRSVGVPADDTLSLVASRRFLVSETLTLRTPAQRRRPCRNMP